MSRKIQFVLGLLLAVGAFCAVLVVNTITRPPVYPVAVIVADVPPYTVLTPDMVQIDEQSMSDAVYVKYISAREWEAMLAAGPVVAVEPLHPGQPLLKLQVATGENADKVKRLSVALTDPERVIVAIPVDAKTLPAVYPGDAVALFYSAGQVQAATLTTDVVTLTAGLVTPPPDPELLPAPVVMGTPEPVTTTLTLQLPLSKWLTNGIVYRLNREMKENSNYGAPGMENEPRYVEGQVQALDVVVRQADAEWLAFALAHGKVQVGVLPAVNVPAVQAGTLPPSVGVTWSDLEDRVFEERLRER